MPTEADTCRLFVVPQLQAAGWESDPHSIAEQRAITDGRIVPKGSGYIRRPPKRVDYLLRYTRDFPLAVVEAMAAWKSATDGRAQAVASSDCVRAGRPAAIHSRPGVQGGVDSMILPHHDFTHFIQPHSMIRHFLLFGLLLAVQALAADDTMLTLPIRFHITQGATMTVKGQTMDLWVTPADLTGPVLTEVNRIWKPANIRFVVERAEVEPLLKPADFNELLRSVENAKRGEEEVAGSGRIANIAKLLDPAQRHPTAHNVYLLPFIGSTYQGYATMGGRQVVAGVWTDKPSRGKNPPVKTLLVEPEPMKVGSLARTVAHELGHNLGLAHPPRDEASPVGRLMGGGKQGYALMPDEIAKARQTAGKHLAGGRAQR